jgi:hypothetical protein
MLCWQQGKRVAGHEHEFVLYDQDSMLSVMTKLVKKDYPTWKVRPPTSSLCSPSPLNLP